MAVDGRRREEEDGVFGDDEGSERHAIMNIIIHTLSSGCATNKRTSDPRSDRIFGGVDGDLLVHAFFFFG